MATFGVLYSSDRSPIQRPSMPKSYQGFSPERCTPLMAVDGVPVVAPFSPYHKIFSVADLVFVLGTDFGVLGFEFVERLADDVEFVDLGCH